jgi:hypothetical protein
MVHHGSHAESPLPCTVRLSDFICALAGTAEYTNGTCSICPDGTFQDEFGRSSCKQCSYGGQYSEMPRQQESASCRCRSGFYALDFVYLNGTRTPLSCTACKDCSLRQAGTYYSKACFTTQDRQDEVACKTQCAPRQYISTPCSCEADVQCSACTDCPAGTYMAGPCNQVSLLFGLL